MVAGVEKEDKEHGELFIDENSPDRPWIDMKSLARVLGKPQPMVEDVVKQTRR